MAKARSARNSNRMAALKRASERRAKSCFLVVIFFAVFACMLVTEVFYVEDERWREEKFLSMFNFGDDMMDSAPPPSNSRVARELKYEENDTVTVEHEDFWQSVSNAKDKFFVYSAYYDDRRTKWVRVIAAARTRLADKVFCRFSFSKGDSLTVVGINRLIRENWNLKYSAYFILCPLKQPLIPTHVSIIKQSETLLTVGNKLLVRNNKKLYKKPEGVAVCIKPLHYEYNKVKNLIEFIELNRIMGVNHFVLYNHTVGPDVECILKKYVTEGVVTVLPWQLDIVSQKEIRTEGLFAALNDCLYRTMYRFRYVLMIDLDEYVIPHKNNSLKVMLEYLLRKNPDRTGAFSFQNAFFYLQWPDDSSAVSLPYKLLTLQKTTRKSKFHAHKQRSKCVILPERVVEMGNHFVWEFITGKTMMNIPPDVGFLHHYRVCEFGGNDCINTTHVTDRRSYAWKDAMVDMISLRLRLLQPVCQNISPFLLE
ncbi:beta-1,4-galactosyltransferase galt-1 [Parasteatoda tepidariorum]|uniref:beta-1,4-galactosyltransferase galt-1 n=1 Tax=Parasteatoda tepidariorum TaxID=114398 RepID=UPI00077FA158|nr:glycosyltransferase family 92 protein F13G3.3 [Parasteatoda tepidariorum]